MLDKNFLVLLRKNLNAACFSCMSRCFCFNFQTYCTYCVLVCVAKMDGKTLKHYLRETKEKIHLLQVMVKASKYNNPFFRRKYFFAAPSLKFLLEEIALLEISSGCTFCHNKFRFKDFLLENLAQTNIKPDKNDLKTCLYTLTTLF